MTTFFQLKPLREVRRQGISLRAGNVKIPLAIRPTNFMTRSTSANHISGIPKSAGASHNAKEENKGRARTSRKCGRKGKATEIAGRVRSKIQ